ncbi:MAG: EFR1 family ferrodoxin [Anaerovoracaceae bacterium]
MIIYFSGTGNSKYVAKAIQKVTGDQLVSMNDLIKSNVDGNFQSDKPFVIVAPTYSWRLPKIVAQFLKSATFTGNKKAYFILTCGSESGNAQHYIEEFCSYKGLEFMGFASVVMPENYIAMFSVPDKKESDQIISAATDVIFHIAKKISNVEPLDHVNCSLLGKIESSLVYQLFYPLFVKSKGFHSTESCNGCRQCANICPLNNIQIVDGKPKWGSNCTHCMACIARCPMEAIEYKHKSQGQPRFFNDQEPQVPQEPQMPQEPVDLG